MLVGQVGSRLPGIPRSPQCLNINFRCLCLCCHDYISSHPHPPRRLPLRRRLIPEPGARLAPPPFGVIVEYLAQTEASKPGPGCGSPSVSKRRVRGPGSVLPRRGIS